MMIFGPNKSAVRLEISKEFSKDLMNKYNIPTASYKVFDKYESCIEYAKTCEYPIVLKFSGLAFGKGVVIVKTIEEYLKTAELFLKTRLYGSGGVVVEEFLIGEEFSYIGLVSDDLTFTPFCSARDYKRVYDNDLGENTGGMGMIAPHPTVTKEDEVIATEIVNNTLNALKQEGIDYSGFIYAGLMKTKSGIKVIEFNARMGDPEGELLFNKLTSDIILNIYNAINNLEVNLEFDDLFHMGVVLAASGYPTEYVGNIDLSSYNLDEYLPMNTKLIDGKLHSGGGRVLFKRFKHRDLSVCINENYKQLSLITNDDLFYRQDIGRNFENSNNNGK